MHSAPCVLSPCRSPQQPFFLKGVRLVNSGDYSSAVDHLEEALRLYLHECDLCRADCEVVVPLPPATDYYMVLAGQSSVSKKESLRGVYSEQGR